MKYISPFFSDARNKLGGSVFARNRAGTYARAKVNPTQPRTTSQVANRASFGTYATMWKSLTQAQIQAWNEYASTATLTDSLGHSFRPSGIQCFVSCNRYAGFLHFGSILNPPKPIAPFQNIAPAQVEFAVPASDPPSFAVEIPGTWDIAGTQVIISATPSLSPGINFIKRSSYRRLDGPYTWSDNVLFFTDNYLAVFPTPTVGSRVGIRMQLASGTTGLAGAVTTADAIVITF